MNEIKTYPCCQHCGTHEAMAHAGPCPRRGCTGRRPRETFEPEPLAQLEIPAKGQE